MTAVTRSRRAKAQASAIDIGPRFGKAHAPRADVAVMDRPDPDHPNRTVRGACRRSGYDWLHARGVLSDVQREAADRYCVAHERLHGASSGDNVGGRRPPWQQGHPSHGQVQAAADIRRAQAVIRAGANRIVLDGVVLDGRTMDGLAMVLSEPVAGITGRLRAVLDILADAWGLD